MAMDPVGFQEGNIHSHNRYTYANNNPFKFVDPDGREAADVASVLGDVAGQQFAETAKVVETVVSKTLEATKNAYVTALSFSPIGFGRGLGLKGSEVVMSREVAKDALFATKSAGEINSAFGWGTGLQGAKDARSALASDPKGVMANIQSQATRSEAEAAKSLYASSVKEGKGLPVSTERSAYMSDVLNLWK